MSSRVTPGVLDRVVEQGRGDGDVVEPEVGHDAGDRQRVLRRRARPSRGSAPVGVGRLQVGPGDQRGGRLGVPLPEGVQQGRDLVRRRLVVAPPRQDPVDRGHPCLLLSFRR